MTYRPTPYAPPHRPRPRLTRRGWLVLLLGAALAAAAAVVVALLLARDEPPAAEQPRSLLVPEGRRSAQVYASVDRALGLAGGAARKAATAPAALPLPAEARGNPEGYLFPATYPVLSTTTPEDLLRFMVDTAGKRFGTAKVAEGAKAHGMSVYEAVIAASIVQAEADNPDDMAKVARVVHNRLARGMALQMDSTLNYALDRSTVDTTREDTRSTSPYNTYARKGLPPTPIGNPGDQALDAVVRPADGDWLYFVTVAPGDTRFTADYASHQVNVAEFNANRRSGKP
ncbi:MULTISPECIES: endolytic transglycosylase MltG [unclassified Streptomyces]|uniref:endolytic transglycosylase MltG n=1 Tax=unclassified Streptomyces TaxID=2593676 RepID=UPI0006B02BEA|nr:MULTISPECIES: endolytic transglycosylase MltG [unclassified Streptomyces]KOX17675.1 aminodeoxychorismate lyase [Streptomyces sp. NRRL F-6491]KOX36502.1 aminodeoxychorismate lyase [Streptomyces sp. NRRL F-6492]